MLEKFENLGKKTIVRKSIDIFDNQKNKMDEKLTYTESRKGVNSFATEKNFVNVQVVDKKSGEVIEEQNNNLIVYHGRSWLMQRAFNLNLGAQNRSQNDNTSGIIRPGYNNKYISWLSVGTGGSTGECALDPDDSYETDYELNDHGTIWNGSAINDGNMRYRDINGVWRDYHAFDANYPVFLDDWNVTGSQPGYQKDPRYPDYLEDVSYGGFKADSYLKALVRVTISPTECNGPKFYDAGAVGEYYQNINEFGLYAAPDHNWLNYKNTYLYDPNNSGQSNNWKIYRPELFAKVNLSTIRKDESREIIVNWYLYF
jgi:hypothetical protein